jgi:hypothetical protein
MIRIVVFAGAIALMAAAALMLNTSANSGQTRTATSEKCQTVDIKPDTGYGVQHSQKLLVCR